MSERALVPTAWTTGTTEVFKTGTWRAALPRHIHAPSPCHVACPVNGEIAEWIGLARAGDLRGAWHVLARHNPFPAIVGRICHHPCESACNRAALDGAVSIRALERHVGGTAIAQGWGFDAPGAARGERIAIIGGGPSGLSAAFHLRRSGYAVTLHEARSALGGVMRHGIPPYRLPRAVLDAEIARVLELGIEVRCGEALSTRDDLERMRTRFDAVYLAIGAGRAKRVPALDYTKPWMLDGSAYLAAVSTGDVPTLGRRVVVIGGGSAAMDVARTARRAGHEVTVLALESMADMPAQREEIEQAREEGVRLLDSAMLTEAIEAGALGVIVRCARVRFERGAAPGEFTTTVLPDRGFCITADAIIAAIGQDPEVSPFRDLLELNGRIVRTDASQATSVPGCYAGGDLTSHARFVTDAIAAGKRAAHAIDARLRGRRACAAAAESVVPFAAINSFYHAARPRAVPARADALERLATSCEVEQGLAGAQALAEMQRCFSCGTCIHCDNCVEYCPDLAVRRDNGGYIVLGDYCKGCGVCVRECPTGSMRMIEEAR